jgi:hypothetical protein
MPLRVTIELIPHGDESLKDTVFQMNIQNDGTSSDRNWGNYTYQSEEIEDTMRWNNWRKKSDLPPMRIGTTGRFGPYARAKTAKELVMLIIQQILKQEYNAKNP